MSGAALEGVRSRLIALAAQEIRQIGPRRMSISGLAARLGMSHANVYHYFADKAALVDAVLNGWLRGIELRLQEIVDGPDPADDKLERFLTTLARAYAEAQRGDGAVFALLAERGLAAGEAGRHRRRIGAWLERIVEEGIATRLFHGIEARRGAQLAADLTAAFCDPCVLAVRPPEGALEQRRDRVIRAALRALIGR